jgi:hypothetical protein
LDVKLRWRSWAIALRRCHDHFAAIIFADSLSLHKFGEQDPGSNLNYGRAEQDVVPRAILPDPDFNKNSGRLVCQINFVRIVSIGGYWQPSLGIWRSTPRLNGGRTMFALQVGRLTGRVSATSIVAPVVGIALVAILAALAISPALADAPRVELAAGGGAPGSAGVARLELENGVLEGSATANDLPKQEFGSGHFYGVWFVRTDTGDKAFLGALSQDESIILSHGGRGKVEFAGTKFTTGPDAETPIRFGAAGTNLVIILIENNINGLTPSPVGPVPGSGVALSGTF